MQIFRIGAEGLKAIKKQMLTKTIPVMVMAVIVGGGISTINSKDKISGIGVVLVVIVFMVLIVARAVYAAMKKQNELFRSYTLTITNNLITREQLNTPTVAIYFDDIKQIVRNKNGSIIIKGKDAADLIIVPPQIDNYAALEATLNRIQPINEKVSASFLERSQLLLAIISGISMICVYVVRNKIIVGIAGVLFVGLAIWGLVKIQQSKNVDNKTKRGSWWIIVVLASVIFVMIMKMSDMYPSKTEVALQESKPEKGPTGEFQNARLTDEERRICDSMQIDTTVIVVIRQYNSNNIEPFHYSLSKIMTKDGEIEATPKFLDGLVFTETANKAHTIVFALKDEMRKKGYSIFIVEDNLASPKGASRIAILKTTDKYSILKQIGTDGINYDITNDSLLSIIRDFDKKYDLELIAASGDWCEFIIHKEPGSWSEIAGEAYKACPDLVDQGTGTVEELANEMKRTRRLYFWWD